MRLTDHDYVICGGQLLDGDRATLQCADLRVKAGMIEDIGPSLSRDHVEVIDAAGLIVSPGLIDLHVHVFSGIGIYSIDPAAAGLRHGVTTMLDTGTAGALTYPAFERFVIRQSAEDIFALLNISMIGAIQGHPQIDPYLGDLNEVRHAHLDSAVKCIEEHRDRIVGTKVRLTSALANYSIENEYAGLRGAIGAAERTELPCMIHHAMSQIRLKEVLESLRPGDIYTHCFHPYYDNGFGGETVGRPCEDVQVARDRGILFDVGHGLGGFSWTVAEAARDHGFWPDTISSDLHHFNVQGPVFDLPTTLTKFLFLGMPIARVLQAATSTPADAMRVGDRFGRLRAGRQADIVLLRLQQGSWELRDGAAQIRTHHERIVPVAVCKAGRWSDCGTFAYAHPVRQEKLA